MLIQAWSFQSFRSLKNQFLYKILLCCWFHYFSVLSWILNLSESCLEKVPVSWSFSPVEAPSNGIEIDYTQIGTLCTGQFQNCPSPPPPGQTPGHLTFLIHLGQIPRYVASLDGQMPHPLELQRGSNPSPSRHVKAIVKQVLQSFQPLRISCSACLRSTL